MAQSQLGLYGQCPAEIRLAVLCVNARVYDLGPDAPRPAEHQRRRLGEEEERAAGGPGPGAVDPRERVVLTERMTEDCGGVGPNITHVGLTFGMDGLIARLHD